jgi:ABC-type nitrate/sulfonate/bicarbonate transport system substrate-binding protein
MKIKRSLWLWGVAITGTIVGVCLWLGLRGNVNDSARPRLTMGIQISPAMTLVMIAKDKGFFEQEGIDIELKEFTAGKFALQAFLGGSIDLAVTGEVPACLAAMQGNDFIVVTQVVERTTNEVRVVARRDGNLTKPKAYFQSKKRKLSTSFGGGPEFYTVNFLKHFGVSRSDVELVSQRPEDMTVALQSGSVDAIAIFDPFAYIAEKRLGDNGITFSDSALYSELYIIAAARKMVASRPEVISSLVKALARAGKYVEKDPEQAKTIVEKYTTLDRDVVDGIWPNFVFRPALTPQLLEYLEAEAKWAKESETVRPDTPIPNFQGMIDASFLRAIAPDLVGIQ